MVWRGSPPDNPTEEELVLLAEHYAAMASERDHLDPPGGIAAWHDSYVHLWDLDAEIAMLRAEGLFLPAAASTLADNPDPPSLLNWGHGGLSNSTQPQVSPSQVGWRVRA